MPEVSAEWCAVEGRPVASRMEEEREEGAERMSDSGSRGSSSIVWEATEGTGVQSRKVCKERRRQQCMGTQLKQGAVVLVPALLSALCTTRHQAAGSRQQAPGIRHQAAHPMSRWQHKGSVQSGKRAARTSVSVHGHGTLHCASVNPRPPNVGPLGILGWPE